MSFAYFLEEETITSILLALLSGIPTGIFGIVSYVLTSMALYTMAQRRQISKAWLAWVPVFNCWIIGSLSDQYRYVAKGQVKSKRKILLILNILEMVLTACVLVAAISVVVDLLGTTGHSAHYYGMMTLLKPLFGVAGLGVLLAGIGIAATAFRFMALYDVYVSVDPANAVLFLVLSILIHIVEPFFLFFNRDKDTGMPPRREVPQPPVFEPENKDYL